MKKLLSILVLALLVNSYAQAQKRGNKRDQIKSLRVAFITEKLPLTSAEAEKFWPVYNEFDAKRATLRKEFRKSKKAGGTDELTDDEAERQISASFENQEKLIQLKRNYFEKFKKILPAKKVARLERTEREFKAVVMKEMRKRRAERKGKRGRRGAN